MRANRLIRGRAPLGAALLSFFFLFLSACGEEAPPFEDLPLRDALSASPEALAGMPEQARFDLALRLMDEGDEQALVDIDAAENVGDLVVQADLAREEQNKDAIVLGAIERSLNRASLRALPRHEEEDSFEPLVMEGDPDAATASLEEAAMRGRAGAILAHMRANSGAIDIVRVTGWPAGAVVADRTIYVSSAWLVAMSALEPPAEAPAAPKIQRPYGSRSLSPMGAGADRTGSIHRNNTGPDYDHDSCGGRCLDTCNDVCYDENNECICQLRTTPQRFPWGGLALLLGPVLYASFMARRTNRP